MPRRDAKTFLSENQAVTAQAVSTNSISKGIAQAQINTAAKPLFCFVEVVTTLTDGGTNAGTNVDLIDAASSDLVTTSQTVLQAAFMPIIPQATVAGTKFGAMIPTVPSTHLYWGIRYSPVTANLTGGAFTAWVSNQRELANYAPPSYLILST
jgi:hypothetical protein